MQNGNIQRALANHDVRSGEALWGIIIIVCVLLQVQEVNSQMSTNIV
jgi:hypothetical protein